MTPILLTQTEGNVTRVRRYGNTVQPRPVHGTCWCGRPIRTAGNTACAEHYEVPPFDDGMSTPPYIQMNGY